MFNDTLGKKNVIHLNNAGSSLMPAVVLKAQVDHLNLEAEIGGYEASDREAEKIQAVYTSVATLINCQPSEVAIVENATVGWSMAFYAIPFKPGDRILTAEAEYASNYLAYLQIAKEKGVSIDIIPSGENGILDLAALEHMIDHRVKLISITHVPTNSGLVNPIAEIGEIARKHDILYLVDACQSAGQIPLDVEKINCDILSATARKYLRGPRGVGFLYVKSSVIETLHPPMIDLFSADWVSENEYVLRKDARRFENWENNYAAKIGMGAAIDYALDIGLENIEARITELADYFRSQLRLIDGVFVHTHCPVQCGIISFALDGLEAETVKERLKADGINVSVTTPFSTLIDATRRQLPNMVRVSVHYFNDKDELDRVLDLLRKIAK
ncbi:MAG: aminotransferase class V-fold PLP-dependent enzyme [Sneathiella sp.]|nr:aminotransferase class V-fold PLP-dependent enzyme [Sneathiella sp.]